MGIIGSLVLVGIGVLIGYAYFHYRKKPADHFADQDYLDCESSTDSKSALATCYIDKKTAKIRKELEMAD